MTQQRFWQIKRYFKLIMGFEEKKPGTEGYNPCAKYDYIYRCLIHNMAYVIDRTDLDCTIDETTWGFSGFSGEAGGRLMNKPVSKGMSVVYHFHSLSLMQCGTPHELFIFINKVDKQPS